MRAPEVYNAITAVSAELAITGIAKSRTNLEGQYQYRSIDDVLGRLAPLLAKHRLCVLPRALDRTSVDRSGLQNTLLVSVQLQMAFDLVSAEDASVHTVVAYGEALDEGDKATAKAMSAAYKSAMLQTFCIPVAGQEDSDATTHKLKRGHEPEPVQGWELWSREIIDMIGICESKDALGRVQDRHRVLLKGLSRERADLYGSVGEAFAQRQHMLAPKMPTTIKARAKQKPEDKRAARTRSLEHA